MNPLGSKWPHALGLLWGVLLICWITPSYSQVTYHPDGTLSAPGPKTVCPAGEHNLDHFVPPPALLKALKAGTLKSNAIIDVSFIGFDEVPEARAAFQAAVDIWSSLIKSEVTIRVEARWDSLAPGVLGSAGASRVFSNFSEAPTQGVWYPVALAEKLARRELNLPTESDIFANFNNQFPNWYFGTDGNTPFGQFDLLTVVLHEFCHGLGFAGLGAGIEEDSGLGELRVFNANLPSIYSSFLQDQERNRLTDQIEYPDPGIALANVYTSENLFFGGNLAIAANGGLPPNLYAPSVFNSGSSISHLDTDIYTGTVNGLMVHALSPGGSIQDPGPITLALFADMGWVNTFFEPEDVLPQDADNTQVPVTTRVLSDTTLNTNSVMLHFSFDNFASEDSVQMLATGTENQFQGVIDQLVDNATAQYYFSARDATNRTYQFPLEAPIRRNFLSFAVSQDNTAPSIQHTPSVNFLTDQSRSLDFVALVEDAFGVDTVFVRYQLANGTVDTLGLSEGTTNTYSGQLQFNTGELVGGNSFSYQILAQDLSTGSPLGQLPVGSTFDILVQSTFPAQRTYSNNFDTSDSDSEFFGNLFFRETPSGFANAALHSAHPYPEGGPNTDVEFISQLAIPIILQNNRFLQIMEFDEIVLVEPGENNSVFGDENFFDFVITEASNDGGETWQSLAPGYDSRDDDTWENTYNDGIPFNSSTSEAVGSPDLFRTRFLDLGEVFDVGDTLFIRFRLFSDPIANGWGWAIDNLEIQTDQVNASADLLSQKGTFLYPNPSRETVKLQLSPDMLQGPGTHIRIFNAQGALIQEIKPESLLQNAPPELDISHLAPGLYIFQIDSPQGWLRDKLMVR